MPKELHVHVREEDGSLWATVDEFPGVFATGDDLEELRESVAEGVALMLARAGEKPPKVTIGELLPESVATAELVCA